MSALIEWVDLIYPLIVKELDKTDWVKTFCGNRKDIELFGIEFTPELSLCCTVTILADLELIKYDNDYSELNVINAESSVWIELFKNNRLININYQLLESIIEKKLNEKP